MPASEKKGGIPTKKEMDNSKKADLLTSIDKQYNDELVIPKSKVKKDKVGPAAKKLKKTVSNTRFSMIKLTAMTTVDEFKTEISKVLEPLNEDSFKKGKLMFDTKMLANRFPHSWEDCGSSEWVDPFLIDLNDMIKVGSNLRKTMLGMTFTLSGVAEGTEYKDLLCNSYVAINTALLEYKANLNSCIPLLIDEVSWRSEESGDCFTNAGGKGFRNTRDRCRENIKTVRAHNKLIDKVMLNITAKNFANMLTVISKAGIRHGSTVANSHRAQMNKMMDKFDGIVSTMNADFTKRLSDLNAQWEVKYNAMETRLNKEINRLEAVIEESQRLNKEYASNLDSLLTRVEGLNLNTDSERQAVSNNANRSKALYDGSAALSENFKNTEKIIKEQNKNQISTVKSEGMSGTKIALAAGGTFVVVAGLATYLVSSGKNGKTTKRSRYG